MSVRFKTSNGTVHSFDDDALCMDCNTPVVIVDDEGDLVRICHDQTCPRAYAGGISDWRHHKLYGGRCA